MTHQHTEARIIYPEKGGTLKTHGTPLHVLRNNRVPRNPCWRILSKIIFLRTDGNPFWRAQIQIHIY